MMEFCYVPGCEFLEVNHLDGNKTNNYIGNCQWCTPKENTQHAIENNLRKRWDGNGNPKCKLTENDARAIYDLYHTFGYEISEIINQFPIANISMIKNIVTGKTWSYIIQNV